MLAGDRLSGRDKIGVRVGKVIGKYADKSTDFGIMQDYLGHRNPRHTAHYSRTSPARFNKI
jgi:hypothetical protein